MQNVSSEYPHLSEGARGNVQVGADGRTRVLIPNAQASVSDLLNAMGAVCVSHNGKLQTCRVEGPQDKPSSVKLSFMGD